MRAFFIRKIVCKLSRLDDNPGFVIELRRFSQVGEKLHALDFLLVGIDDAVVLEIVVDDIKACLVRCRVVDVLGKSRANYGV